jgi:Tol biopolymer transport system component/tRNA A-37 threonylcarbamoyl transferase component Bud32
MAERIAATLVDRYRIERELGAGGMATVYLAEDVRHHRKVALKVLHPELSAVLGPERFLKEIELTASLQHPHILPLFDSGSADGQLFYVMPFVEGETLRTRLERERQLPIADVLRIAREVADALQYAHGRGVIHRDIKPENVLLQGGHALVVDFGIALAVTQIAGSRLTDSGISLGTPHYMAPEQAMGEKAIDARADVYALGAVTYEMLAGEPPFTGPTAQAIVGKVMNTEPPAVTSLRASVPASLAAAVHTALQKLPADRFPTAESFAEALTAGGPFGRHGAVTGARPARRGVRRWLAPIALVAAGSALGWIARSTSPRAGPATPVSHHSILLPEGTIFSTYPRPWGLALSPDGGTIVYSASVGPDQQRLYVKRPGNLDAQAMAGTEGGVHPFFSSDGMWVAFFADRALKKVSMVSGSVEVIARLDEATGAGSPGSWGEDGTLLFGQVGDIPTIGIASVSATGGAVTILTRPDHAQGEARHVAPQRLPGTETLLYTVVNGARRPRVMARPLRGGAPKLVLDRARGARYLGNGRLIYEIEGELFTARFDVNTLVVSEPIRVLGGVIRHPNSSGWAAAGAVLVYRPAVSRVLVWVRRDGLRTRLALPPKDYSTPKLSPAGDRVAVAAADRDRSDVWIGDLRREVMMKASSDGQTVGGVWTPDGERLTVSRTNGSRFDLYSLRADGSGGSDSLFANGALLWPAAWTRDSRTLVVMQGDSLGGDLWVLDPADRRSLRPLVRTPAGEWGGRLSSDERWLAYFSDVSGRYELYVTAFPDGGRRWQVSREGASEAVWSRDGRELFFRNGDQLFAVPIKAGATFDWDPPRVLFEGSYHRGGGPGSVQYDVSPDGTRFLMIEDAAAAAPRFNVVQGWDRVAAAGVVMP